jgi:hypothetical protein
MLDAESVLTDEVENATIVVECAATLTCAKHKAGEEFEQ